ncbi:MAG: hypothetical protein R3A47_05970 [Polyangiales bacterium]
MALDAAFVADCPYGPGGLLLTSIDQVDKEAGVVLATMDVNENLPITATQRVHPVKHPRHVSGGLMVHVTGVLGFAHAYYVLGLRHADGWIGYGARIYNARFASLAAMDGPLKLRIEATRVRRLRDQIYARYEFEFHQNGRLVYESDQGAMWMLVRENATESTAND